MFTTLIFIVEQAIILWMMKVATRLKDSKEQKWLISCLALLHIVELFGRYEQFFFSIELFGKLEKIEYMPLKQFGTIELDY